MLQQLSFPCVKSVQVNLERAVLAQRLQVLSTSLAHLHCRHLLAAAAAAAAAAAFGDGNLPQALRPVCLLTRLPAWSGRS